MLIAFLIFVFVQIMCEGLVFGPDYRCVSDCISSDHVLDPGPAQWFCGD